MTEQLAACSTMAKDLSSVPSTHIEQLTSLQQNLPSAPGRYRYIYSSSQLKQCIKNDASFLTTLETQL